MAESTSDQEESLSAPKATSQLWTNSLDNMDNITEEYRGNFAKGVPGDE
mgnify:CR=1 FL=1